MYKYFQSQRDRLRMKRDMDERVMLRHKAIKSAPSPAWPPTVLYSGQGPIRNDDFHTTYMK